MPFSIQHPHHLRTSPAQPVTASPATALAVPAQLGTPRLTVAVQHLMSLSVAEEGRIPTADVVVLTLLLLLCALLADEMADYLTIAVQLHLTLRVALLATPPVTPLGGALLRLLSQRSTMRPAVGVIPTTV